MHHLTQELAFTERVNEKGRAKLSPNVTKCQSSCRTFDNPRQIESRVIQNSLHVIAILGDGSWKRETMYIDNTLPKMVKWLTSQVTSKIVVVIAVIDVIVIVIVVIDVAVIPISSFPRS